MDLISQCALPVAKVVWRPGHGGFAFTVVCKATFELLPDTSPLAAAQEPIVEADVYSGEGGGITLASELLPFKKRPDVLVIGHAYAPKGRPVPSLMARMSVREIDKAIQVVGDRSFDPNGKIGDPAHFTRMPLVWERAAGGLGTSNPAGMPLGDAAQADAHGRVLVPNLLPIGMRLLSRSDVVPPVGFGPIAPLWPSRAARLGRHASGWDPSRWHERPFPADIDLAYFNAAPRDQQRALPFSEEVIYLENLHPRFMRLATRLALVTPTATVDRSSDPHPLQLRCDTLVIDTDRGLAMLVWRAHVLLDRPDLPGSVVVTGPTAIEAARPARAEDMSDDEDTLPPGALLRSSIVLPFAGGAAPFPSSFPPPPSPSSFPPPPSPSSFPPPPYPSSYPPPPYPSSYPPPPYPSSFPPPPMAGATATATGATAAPAAAAASGHTEQTRVGKTTLLYIEHQNEKTLVPGGGFQAAALPFASSQSEGASRRDSRLPEGTSALPFRPSSAENAGNDPPTQIRPDSPALTSWQATSAPWVASWPPPPPEAQPPPAPASPWVALADPPRAFAPLPSPASEPPTPLPPLLGAIVALSKGTSETRDTERTPPAGGDAPSEAPAAAPEPEIAFDAYPPERCGSIAARVACSEGIGGDILRAEDLDAARWQRVHEHWLDRIRDETSRSRKKLLSDYDGAYVSALEAHRGQITLDDYARLAEAAERSAIADALAERSLPEGAWPHIHRVWIQRMVKDVRISKQVRAAIDALRAGAEPRSN